MARMHHTICGLAIAGAMMAALPIAQADDITYDFSGQCTDCSGTVSAELVVQNYTPGTELTDSNLVSFHYDGSNLFSAYTINSFAFLSGVIPSGSGWADFDIQTASLFFDSFAVDGNWQTGTSGGGGGGGGRQGADHGTDGMWSSTPTTPPPDTVPEPGTLALLSTVLVGFGLLRRSRKV